MEGELNKTVDLYLPLDSRDEPNAEVWPVAQKQLKELIEVINKCGWKVNVLNPNKPVACVAEGIRVIAQAKGEKFINFMAGWAYPDFSVSPMWQLPPELPKLMLGSAIPDYPGAVGLLAAASGTTHMGIETSRLFVKTFEKQEEYLEPIKTFLDTGRFVHPYPETIEVFVGDNHREKAKKVVKKLKGSIYGAIGPRSMQMWNKISEADFLKYFGIAREGLIRLDF